MPLPLHKRYEIAFLTTHPKGPKLSFRETAKQVRCDEKTVREWAKRWQESKDLSDKPRPGRQRVTTQRQDNQILKLAKENVDISAPEIRRELLKQNIDIHVRTIQRRLGEGGARYYGKLVKPLLGEKHRKKRLSWAKEHKDFDWNSVIFTDESTFRLNQRLKKAWQFVGARKITHSVKHPLKVHVWGCFSSSSFGRLVCFTRNLNAQYMTTLYETALLPSAVDLFGEGCDSWILQEDNDPKHRSKITKAWKKENEIKVLPWPSMSPDQNPIENVWGLMKMNLAKKKIRKLSTLKGQITKEWNQLPKEYAANLVRSMRRRVEALIEAEGDYTMH